MVASANDVDWHPRAIGSRRPLARRRVQRRVHVGGWRLLQQHSLTGQQVVFEDGCRRGERLIAVAQRAGVPLGIGIQLELVRLVAQIDDADVAVAANDPNTLLRIRPLVHHQVIGERFARGDALTGDVGHQFGPLAGRIQRRSHHAEVFGLQVGQHHEHIAPVIDAVLDALDAIAHTGRGRQRICCGYQPCLTGLLAGRLDDDPFAAAAQIDAQVEPLVAFFVDQHIVALLAADGMAPHLIGPHLVVGHHVEQLRCVGRPCSPTPRRGAAEHVVQICAGCQIADAQRVQLAAIDIAAPRGERMVGADLEQTQREELGVERFDVLVQQHEFGGGLQRGASTVDRVVQALFGSSGVPPAVLAYGHGHIGFLYTRLDLFEQRVRQLAVRSEPLVGEDVLGFQVGNGVGVVTIAQPRPRIVDVARGAMPHVRHLLGDGRVSGVS